MPRGTSILLVGVAALAVAAAVDALRREPPPPAPDAAEREPAIADELRSAGARGVLVYADGRCRLRAVRLPELGRAAAPAERRCRFSLSPDGRSAAADRTVWEPHGRLLAVELADSVEVASASPAWRHRFPDAAAPAFKPDGTVTFVRAGELVAWTTDCPPGASGVRFPGDDGTLRCPHVVLATRDLERSIRDLLLVPPGASASLRHVAWLDDERVATVVHAEAGGSGLPVDVLVVFRGRDAVARPELLATRLGRLEPSPDGRSLAVTAARGDITILDRAGRPAGGAIAAARAFAWSPDSRWIAVARRDSVVLYDASGFRARIDPLPLDARDLAWR